MSSDTDPVFDPPPAASTKKKTFECTVAGCIFNVDESIFFEDVHMRDAHVAEHLTCPYFFCREKYTDETSMKEHEMKHDKANNNDFGCSWIHCKTNGFETLREARMCEWSHLALRFEKEPHWRCTELKDNGEVCHEDFEKEDFAGFDKHLTEVHKISVQDVLTTSTKSEVMMNGHGFWCRYCGGGSGEVWSNDDKRLPKYGNEPWAWVFRYLDHVSTHSITTEELVGDAEDTDEGEEGETDDVEMSGLAV